MEFKQAFIDAFMLLLNAQEACHVDDLPCKAATLEARAMLGLFGLLETDLNLSERQYQVLTELKQYTGAAG